jgi:hypothetical protein
LSGGCPHLFSVAHLHLLGLALSVSTMLSTPCGQPSPATRGTRERDEHASRPRVRLVQGHRSEGSCCRAGGAALTCAGSCHVSGFDAATSATICPDSALLGRVLSRRVA